MQALILATDEASKLYPLTAPLVNGAHLPAPLLPVLNRPIMAYPLELLVRAGLRDIGIAVYNKAGSIEAHFATGSRSGAQLTYLLQREALGSAGSLRWAASGLREAFVVLPGDAIVDFDICAALAFHQSHGGIATVIAHKPLPDGALHPVAVAADGRVAALSSGPVAPDAQVFADTGAYIFDPRILHCIPPRKAFDCYNDLLPALLVNEGAHESVQAYVADGYWNPIDSVPAYHQAQLDALVSAAGASLANGAPQVGGAAPAVRYVSVGDRELAPGILTGRQVSVHPSARLIAPVYIGPGSQIERDVELGPGVVIGANTVVDEGATILNSSVLEGTYVGRLVKVDTRVVRGGLIIDAGSGESLRIVDRFLLGEVSPRLIVRPMARLLSRAADCAGALFLLLLALPALVLIALALLLTSILSGRPGRVFELRPRVRWRLIEQWRGTGEDDAPQRQTYGVLHFRTRREDGRPAPVGSFLERSQLDRIPALLSVLKGDLRLVGVKPLDPSEADRLVEEWQRLPYEGTHSHAAGFTGLWYVRLPQDASETDLDEIVATDAYYTATRSFLEDLHLLLSTPAAWVGSFGPLHPAPRQLERTRKPQWTVWRSGANRRLLPVALGRTGVPDNKSGGVGFGDSGPANAQRP